MEVLKLNGSNMVSDGQFKYLKLNRDGRVCLHWDDRKASDNVLFYFRPNMVNKVNGVSFNFFYVTVNFHSS